MKLIEVTILGCGTSTGVPIIGCPCKVCQSTDTKNSRTRASVFVKVEKLDGQIAHLLIDTATDLRFQALREKIPRVDAVLYTHPHADHVGGIDELRSFNFLQKSSIPLFGNEWTVQELNTRFPYIFSPKPVEGGGIPLLTLNRISSSSEAEIIEGVEIIPFELRHGSQEVLGFRIGSFAYITDCHFIPDASYSKLQDLDILVLDCLRFTPHATHLNFDEAMNVAGRINARSTYLTHMGHDMDYNSLKKMLPKSIFPAFDGLKLYPKLRRSI